MRTCADCSLNYLLLKLSNRSSHCYLEDPMKDKLYGKLPLRCCPLRGGYRFKHRNEQVQLFYVHEDQELERRH